MPSRVKIPQPLGQPAHCTALTVRNIPLISNCNFLSYRLWLLPLGFPVPLSGKGRICPVTPYTTKASCWFVFSLFSISIIRYFSSELFPPSCPDELCYLVTSARMWIYLHWIPWSVCQSLLQPGQVPLNRGSAHLSISCSSLKFICRHGEGAIPLFHPGWIIHPVLLLGCSYNLQCYVNKLVLHHFLLE